MKNMTNTPTVPRDATATWRWRTDAASGELAAASAEEALALLIADNEWSEIDSDSERHCLADGSWLTIFDRDGVPAIQRGTMP